MTMMQIFLKEMDTEAAITRKMLALVPNDQFQWKPHEKSMTIQQLATHIAELPSWITLTLNTSELDFAASPYTQVPITNTTSLLAFFEETLSNGRASLESGNEAQLEDPWTLRNGVNIYSTSPKGEVIRMTFSQIVHHRAQLGVYLRLLNISLPGSYGPSADDMNF